MKLASDSASRCTLIHLELEHADDISPALIEKIERACDQAEDAAGHALLVMHLFGGNQRHHAHGTAVDMVLVGKWERTLRRLEKLKTPTAVVMHGVCSGPALEVMLTADYRIAAPDSRIAFVRPDGTIWPGMGLHRLATQIGAARARRLVLFGAELDIRQALELGIVDRIEADAAHAIDALSHELASPALHDISVRRRLLLEAASNSYEDALGSHLAACDRTLRHIAARAESEPQGVLQTA